MNGPNNSIGYCDYTWSPLVGCLNGCPYCWAHKLADGRLKRRYLSNIPVLAGNPNDPFAIRWWPGRLEEPLKLKTPARIFAVDMGDLFGDQVPGWCLAKVFQVVRAAHWHTFLFCTKYPWNLTRIQEWPKNAWVGVSATNFRMAETAMFELEKVKAPVRYISAEPLIASLNDCPGTFLSRLFKVINWMVIGTQTKPFVLPEVRWVEEIMQAADKARVPVYVKGKMWKHFQCLSRRPLHNFPKVDFQSVV